MSKAAKKKAKKQRKAAMQVTAVTKTSPEAPSPVDHASSASSRTSGAELQVCPLTNLALIISCASVDRCSTSAESMLVPCL